MNIEHDEDQVSHFWKVHIHITMSVYMCVWDPERGSKKSLKIGIIFRKIYGCGFALHIVKCKKMLGKMPQKIMKYGLRWILSYYMVMLLSSNQNDNKSTIYSLPKSIFIRNRATKNHNNCYSDSFCACIVICQKTQSCQAFIHTKWLFSLSLQLNYYYSFYYLTSPPKKSYRTLRPTHPIWFILNGDYRCKAFVRRLKVQLLLSSLAYCCQKNSMYWSTLILRILFLFLVPLFFSVLVTD